MNENMQDQQNPQQAPVPTNPEVVQEEKDLSHEKLAASYEIRLKKARQQEEATAKEAEKVRKELDDLKKKFESGKATSNETAQYVEAKNTVDQSLQQGIDPRDLPAIIDQHMKLTKLEQTMAEAQEKDPELKALMQNPESVQKISRDELDSFSYLPNPAAVFKHLLTNDQDRMVLKAAEQAYNYGNGDGGVSYFQFLNNLSNKLKDTAVYPHPSNFKPAANLTDIGESDSFDSESYIKNKYGRSGRG